MADRDLDKGDVPFGNKPALIVVDMTHGFTSHESPLGGAAEEVITANQRLLCTFRLSANPVCFTSVVYEDDTTHSVFRANWPDLNILRPNTHWVEVDERLGRLSNEPVFNKTGPSGFFDTKLSAWLVLNDIDSLVVTGLTTSGCVRATVVDGLHLNYPIWVVEDACGDRNQTAHSANISDMGAKYATIKTTAEVIDYLTPGDALGDADYV